jgi:hypothetical protein
VENTRSHPNYSPAEPGWLALFEDRVDDELVVRAEPVIAWCFANGGPESEQAGPGRAVIGAQPWLEKTPHEDELHCFALVREEQLEPSFVSELKAGNHRSREEILESARKSQENRLKGHGSWVRDRRGHRSHSHGAGVLRVI